ncbi:MAG: peptidoglycan editing factor PgeF [Chlorobi bacterium]|nr:peptidoglycan editing factor PgeF [Chlorobiota bacterium]
MVLTITPSIFKPYPELAAAMTLRRGEEPFGFNFSFYVGDDEERVRHNRQKYTEKLGFSSARLAVQKQVHGDRVVYVDEGYQPTESDALITDQEGWLLGVSTADCVPILLAVPEKSIVGAIHSGWRGSAQNVASKTVRAVEEQFRIAPGELIAWIGPSAGQCCYEVGEDIFRAFDNRRFKPIGDEKFLFDNKGVVLDQLLEAGLRPEKIEIDPRCTICDTRFHSWRRDRKASGRMIAVIGRKNSTDGL